MKRGYIFQDDKGRYLTGGFFWSNNRDDAWVFDDNEIEKNILPNYMKWDWKPAHGFVAAEAQGEKIISSIPVPFWEFDQRKEILNK